jgi:hypothetical protein
MGCIGTSLEQTVLLHSKIFGVQFSQYYYLPVNGFSQFTIPWQYCWIIYHVNLLISRQKIGK